MNQRSHLQKALEDFQEIQGSYRIIENAELVHAWGSFHDWLTGYYSRTQSPLEFVATEIDRRSGSKRGLRSLIRKLGLPKTIESLAQLKNELEKEEKRSPWRQCEVTNDKYHAVCIWTENVHQFGREKIKVLSVLREFQLPIVYRKYTEANSQNNLFCDLSIFSFDEILLTNSIVALQNKLNRNKNVLLWDWPYLEMHRGFSNVLRAFDEVWTASAQAANFLRSTYGIQAYSVGPYFSDCPFALPGERTEYQNVCLLYREEVHTQKLSRQSLEEFLIEYKKSGANRLELQILVQNASEARYIRELQRRLKAKKKIKIEVLHFNSVSHEQNIEAIAGINLSPHAAMDKHGYAAVLSNIPILGMPIDEYQRDETEREFYDTGNPLLKTITVRKHDLPRLVQQIDRVVEDERHRNALLKKQKSSLENLIYNSQGKTVIRNQLSNSLQWN